MFCRTGAVVVAALGLCASPAWAQFSDVKTLRLGDVPAVKLGDDGQDADTELVGRSGGGFHGGSFHGGGFRVGSFHGGGFHGGGFHGGSFRVSNFHGGSFNRFGSFNHVGFRSFNNFGFRSFNNFGFRSFNNFGFRSNFFFPRSSFFVGGFRPFWGSRFWGWPWYGSSFAGYSPFYYSTPLYYSYPSYSYCPISISGTLNGSGGGYNGYSPVMPMPPADAPGPAPRPGPRDDGTYPYDGGPASPVPMPNADPMPSREPVRPAPKPEGRIVSLPAPKTQFAYPAYGDKPAPTSFAQDRVAELKSEPVKAARR